MQLQNISFIHKFNPSQKIRPTNVIFKGNSDSFEPSGIDPDIKELERLAAKYKNNGDIKDKLELWKQEEKILWQEIENPEKYLDRAIKMKAINPISKTREEQLAILRRNALSAIYSQYRIFQDLKLPVDNLAPKFPLINQIITETPDNSPFAKEIKSNALHILGCKYKDLNTATLTSMYKELSSEEKAKADKLRKNYNPHKSADPLKEYKETEDIDKKTKALIQLGLKKSEELETIIPEIMEDKNTAHSLKVAAAWCAGRCQTKENYNSLLKIINSAGNDDKTSELREIALHSFALYLRKHLSYLESRKCSNEVRMTLEKISKQKDDPNNELANVLLKKVEGKYNLPDRVLNEKIPDEMEKERYKKLRSKYVPEADTLGPRSLNKLDEALIPYYKGSIKKLLQKHLNMRLTNDTITDISRNAAGKRIPDGRFEDSIPGECDPLSGIIINAKDLDSFNNLFSHEFKHTIHANILDKKDKIKVEELYKKAIKENRYLDPYAASNQYEYFAQGYEAYNSIYKRHSRLMYYNDNMMSYGAGTRYKLKRLDPDLYNFIEHCIKKYGKD